LSDEADQETDSDDDVAPANVRFAGRLGACESTGCGDGGGGGGGVAAGGGGGGGVAAGGGGGGGVPPGAGACVPLPVGVYPGTELPDGDVPAGVAQGAVLETTDAGLERLPARS
jgi:hypothetical protein